jgi:monoamine oxidase
MITGRRTFLLGTLATGCFTRHPTSSPPSSKKIVVVGAGISGLAVALDLRDRGFDVTVLEAQDRPGGRIHTVRFGDGLYAEAGATHVVGDPDLLALCARALVKIEPRRPRRSDLKDVAFFDGQRRVLAPGERVPKKPPLSPEEQKAGDTELLDKYLGFARRFDPRGAWPPPEIAEWDKKNLGQLLTERGASPGYAEDADGFGDGLTALSAAFVLRDAASLFREIEQGGGGRVEGGTSELPIALAKQLEDQIIFGAKVTLVAQDERGVLVHYERRGERESIEAARVVCAVPHTVLRHLPFKPALPEDKRRAFDFVPSASVARVFAEIDKRTWELRGERGEADTDLFMGRIRDETSLQQQKTHGVLGAYLTGRRARELMAKSDADRVRTLLDDAERVHPGVAMGFLGGASKCWDEDPFARGAYAYFRPGQMTELAPALGRREGRIHFAGDHTSYRPGFMHGAVASAKRVVKEIAETG